MEDTMHKPISIGEWMLTYLLMCIPFVNIVMLFVWAFGGNTPQSKVNWAKASLIWMLIMLVFYLVFFVIMGVAAMAFSTTVFHAPA